MSAGFNARPSQADGPSQHLTESNDTSTICQWARGEALMLKNQCRHNTVTSERFGHLVNLWESVDSKGWRGGSDG